jgi:hypothetical protein
MIIEPVIKLALQFVYFAFEFSHLAVIIEYKTLFSTGFVRKFSKTKNTAFLQGIFEKISSINNWYAYMGYKELFGLFYSVASYFFNKNNPSVAV